MNPYYRLASGLFIFLAIFHTLRNISPPDRGAAVLAAILSLLLGLSLMGWAADWWWSVKDKTK